MLLQIGYTGAITAGQFIQKKVQVIPTFYKELVVQARHHSWNQRVLPRGLRDLALLSSAQGGYSWEPTAAVIQAQEAAEHDDQDELSCLVGEFREVDEMA